MENKKKKKPMKRDEKSFSDMVSDAYSNAASAGYLGTKAQVSEEVKKKKKRSY